MNTKRERRLVLLKYREFKISKRCLGKYLKEKQMWIWRSQRAKSDFSLHYVKSSSEIK